MPNCFLLNCHPVPRFFPVVRRVRAARGFIPGKGRDVVEVVVVGEEGLEVARPLVVEVDGLQRGVGVVAGGH